MCSLKVVRKKAFFLAQASDVDDEQMVAEALFDLAHMCRPEDQEMEGLSSGPPENEQRHSGEDEEGPLHGNRVDQHRVSHGIHGKRSRGSVPLPLCGDNVKHEHSGDLDHKHNGFRSGHDDTRGMGSMLPQLQGVAQVHSPTRANGWAHKAGQALDNGMAIQAPQLESIASGVPPIPCTATTIAASGVPLQSGAVPSSQMLPYPIHVSGMAAAGVTAGAAPWAAALSPQLQQLLGPMVASMGQVMFGASHAAVPGMTAAGAVQGAPQAGALPPMAVAQPALPLQAMQGAAAGGADAGGQGAGHRAAEASGASARDTEAAGALQGMGGGNMVAPPAGGGRHVPRQRAARHVYIAHMIHDRQRAGRKQQAGGLGSEGVSGPPGVMQPESQLQPVIEPVAAGSNDRQQHNQLQQQPGHGQAQGEVLGQPQAPHQAQAPPPPLPLPSNTSPGRPTPHTAPCEADVPVAAGSKLSAAPAPNHPLLQPAPPPQQQAHRAHSPHTQPGSLSTQAPTTQQHPMSSQASGSIPHTVVQGSNMGGDLGTAGSGGQALMATPALASAMLTPSAMSAAMAALPMLPGLMHMLMHMQYNPHVRPGGGQDVAPIGQGFPTVHATPAGSLALLQQQQQPMQQQQQQAGVPGLFLPTQHHQGAGASQSPSPGAFLTSQGFTYAMPPLPMHQPGTLPPWMVGLTPGTMGSGLATAGSQGVQGLAHPLPRAGDAGATAAAAGGSGGGSGGDGKGAPEAGGQ